MTLNILLSDANGAKIANRDRQFNAVFVWSLLQLYDTLNHVFCEYPLKFLFAQVHL